MGLVGVRLFDNIGPLTSVLMPFMSSVPSVLPSEAMPALLCCCYSLAPLSETLFERRIRNSPALLEKEWPPDTNSLTTPPLVKSSLGSPFVTCETLV